jgi:hypothetical protein
MKKKQYLMVGNGIGGFPIIDITSLRIPLSLAIMIALNNEGAIVNWFYKTHEREVKMVFALIETHKGKGKVTALFGHSLDNRKKDLIQKIKGHKNCVFSFD